MEKSSQMRSGGDSSGATSGGALKKQTANGFAIFNNDSHKQPSDGTEKFTENLAQKTHLPLVDTTDVLAEKSQDSTVFLLENLNDFTEYLASPLPPNKVVQIVFFVEKICLLEAVNSKKNSDVILSQIQKRLMKQLETYLVKLSLDEVEDRAGNEAFWKNPEAFWDSLIVVLEHITCRFQRDAAQFLPKIVKAGLITIRFHKNTQGVSVKEAITEKLRHLNDRLKNILKEDILEECSDDYKTINVYPDYKEVLTGKKTYIRKNVIEGNYKSVEEYLDTHFRLLREDFLAPLRRAICTYRESLRNRKRVKIPEFRAYTQARFINDSVNCKEAIFHYNNFEKSVREQSCKILHLGNYSGKHVEKNDSFMTGSLLCFSSDDFETMFSGTVATTHGTNRNVISVQLLEEIPFLYNQFYTMLECTNYFSAYYLVLKVLRNFSTSNFPMEKYIVNVVNESKPPAYLTESTKFTIKKSEFTVLNFESWPPKEELSLNEMQYEAFKHALTSECALIQGPPGTGKTHLGLKIVQTLIENRKAWSSSSSASSANENSVTNTYAMLSKLRLHHSSYQRSAPILVVAYTNHALDQFLAGLVPFTKQIVRIGHQCKNEEINKFTFRSSRNLAVKYDDIQRILIDNKSLIKQLESVLTYKGIFDITLFPELCNSSLYHWQREEVVSWLLGSFNTKKTRDKRWNMVKEISKNFQNDNTNTKFHISVADDDNYILTVSDLKQHVEKWEKKLAYKNTVLSTANFQDRHVIKEYHNQTTDNVAYLQWRLLHAEEHCNLYAIKAICEYDLHKLSYNDRWILYFHWLDCYIQYLTNTLKRNTSTLHELWEKVDKCRQEEDSSRMSQAVIVGMTTSGAARNRHLLENLKCPIVIVEEAAEVLESHIVTSLTSHCQHLILIGDHQQLQPSTADYQIEKEYNLGVSLFERMVLNGICYSTLGVQHRMRPEISRLIAPAIYPSLEDHPSVDEFLPVKGIRHNVFFITHTHPELAYGSSKKNLHEAKYLIALARYLVLQGNDPGEITILTTYKGQMYEIKEEQKNNTCSSLQNVHITVVDNFQGEENQIILLSLVRSNRQNLIGFLATENRVCVALSRAKRGLYIIGNMDLLCQNSEIWPKIREVLASNEQIGPGLQLTCQLHPLNVTIATRPEDFLQVPDGGCYLPCNADLDCGHVCQRKCHVVDLDHTDYKCMEPCTQILCMKNHKCPRKCSQTCGSCEVPMVRVLPCKYVSILSCYMRTENHACQMLVPTLLKCGHTIDIPCFEDKDEYTCTYEVEAVLTNCGHSVKKSCYKPVNEISCGVTINVTGGCGHNIETQCGKTNLLSLKKCSEKCLKKLTCGHFCQKYCHTSIDKNHSEEKYACRARCKKLKAGCKAAHKCSLLCSEPCEPCHKNITKCLPCGHFKTVPCSKSDMEYICESYCKRTKPCGHVCYSKCHPICDYSECSVKVVKSFPRCGHKIKVNCLENLKERVCAKCPKDNRRKTTNIDGTIEQPSFSS